MSDKRVLPYGMGVIDLYEPIWPGGHFYWYEATHYGTRLPQSRAQYDGVRRIADEAEMAREKVGPMVVISWVRTPQGNAAVGGVSNSRHLVGDAIDFWCLRYPADEVFRRLDPIWHGGLGFYPHLRSCHIDSGSKRRW